MKIYPVGAKVFHAERKIMDITKLIVAFHKFENTPKNLMVGIVSKK